MPTTRTHRIVRKTSPSPKPSLPPIPESVKTRKTTPRKKLTPLTLPPIPVSHKQTQKTASRQEQQGQIAPPPLARHGAPVRLLPLDLAPRAQRAHAGQSSPPLHHHQKARTPRQAIRLTDLQRWLLDQQQQQQQHVSRNNKNS